MRKLTARKVETAPPGKYGDGGGLQFVVSRAKSAEVGVPVFVAGRAREMGLGPHPEIGLAEAREKALEARRLVRGGIDPIAERKTDRGVSTFGRHADEVFGDLSQGFRNEEHREQWRTSIARFCTSIRDMRSIRSTPRPFSPCCDRIGHGRPRRRLGFEVGSRRC
jgi:Arm DNA-binding domain